MPLASPAGDSDFKMMWSWKFATGRLADLQTCRLAARTLPLNNDMNCFWISKNEFRISQNNFGYPEMYCRISINQFLDIHNSFLDIQKYIYGYPKIHFWIPKNHAKFWISIIRFLDIHKSFLDIQKSVYFRISKNPFSDIQKSCWI